MARVAGVNIPNEKRIVISLTYVYGIGKSTASKLLKTCNIDESIRTKDLSEDDLNKLRDEIKKSRVEGDLRRDVLTNIRRLKTVGSRRGARHSKHLPVRGQRTKTNSRTNRGNVRKTGSSGRVKVSKT